MLLVDANASVGHGPSNNIGSFQASAADVRKILLGNTIWLPANFESCQEGEGTS